MRFSEMAMPTPAGKIALIQAFCDTTVIGLTVNHENMSTEETDGYIAQYERELGISATDTLTAPGHLLDTVLSAFPQLKKELIASTQ
jgi:uncharacterized NAD-dependent epimerase/dehydratase family protein